MKMLMTLMMLVSASAWADCFELQRNNSGYNKVCVEYDKPLEMDTKGTVTIFKDDIAFYKLKIERKYYPSRIMCTGKEHDCKRVKSSLQLTGQDQFGKSRVTTAIHLWQGGAENGWKKCQGGNIEDWIPSVSRETLYLECPKHWWD